MKLAPVLPTVETVVTRMLFDGPGLPFRADRRIAHLSPGPGEALVRLTLATVCGSDLHTHAGRRSAHLPSVLGHEGVGVVLAVGAGRDAALVGRRVTWTLTDTCGCCRPCTEWRVPQKCDHLFKYGHASLEDGSGLNACFASHIMLRAGTHVVVLPDAVPDAFAAPANCALSTMVAVTEPVPAGAKRVLIQGAGLLGVYGAALLKRRGVGEVFITDAVPERLALAARFGAVPVPAGEAATIAARSCDAVLEVAGVPAVVREGLRVLRPGGVYVFAGMVHPESKLDLTGEEVIRGCFTIVGVHNYAARHLDRAVAFLAETVGEHPWAELVSPPLPLERLDEAFALTAARTWHRVSVRAG